jgi:hypothetical protein
MKVFGLILRKRPLFTLLANPFISCKSLMCESSEQTGDTLLLMLIDEVFQSFSLSFSVAVHFTT